MLAITIDDDVHLELMSRKHAPALFRLIESNREHLRTWLPWLDTNTRVEHSRDFIDLCRRGFAAEHSLTLGLFARRTHLAGIVGFNSINHANRAADIGYWIGRHWQGHGLMTRGVRALIDHGFHHLDLHRIIIRCATHNTRSRAIPERLDFTWEGRQRDAEWLYDHFVDLEVYSLLSHEWGG